MMAGWGRALQITFGAFGILGVLADGAATAAQIINPNPQTQAALDKLVLRYDQVLAIRLRGGAVLPESVPFQNLAGAFSEYLAAAAGYVALPRENSSRDFRTSTDPLG